MPSCTLWVNAFFSLEFLKKNEAYYNFSFQTRKLKVKVEIPWHLPDCRSHLNPPGTNSWDEAQKCAYNVFM